MPAMDDDRAADESQAHDGGRIPGAPGVAAFRVWEEEPSALPVMLSVPHAGRAYPRSLLREMRYPDAAALKLEDRYVDKLGRAIAQETGASLLIAQAPRAMIDLNRAPEDVDWEMFGRPSRPDDAAAHPSRRARSGLGLIPRRLPGMGELWRRRHDEQDLATRIADIHEPYHARLSSMLQGLRDRWGAALLIDLHSMPPLVPRVGQPAAEFVIGDRFGATCHGSLVAVTPNLRRVSTRSRSRSIAVVISTREWSSPVRDWTPWLAFWRVLCADWPRASPNCPRTIAVRPGRSRRNSSPADKKKPPRANAQGGQGSGRRCTECTNYAKL
jgi:N-formylglutamate amidohydrolase